MITDAILALSLLPELLLNLVLLPWHLVRLATWYGGGLLERPNYGDVTFEWGE